MPAHGPRAPSSGRSPLARELDDAMLHLRFNEGGGRHLGVARPQGDGRGGRRAYDAVLRQCQTTGSCARSRCTEAHAEAPRCHLALAGFALIEPGSCFTGTLLELALAADRSYMLDGDLRGRQPGRPPDRALTAMNFGPYPMVNGLTRLEPRFLARPAAVDALKETHRRGAARRRPTRRSSASSPSYRRHRLGGRGPARRSKSAPAFSPDALTGMEANLRFAGPETMESKIFGRLSAWQNWIFQRPNAVGEDGALVKLYGTGKRQLRIHRVTTSSGSDPVPKVSTETPQPCNGIDYQDDAFPTTSDLSRTRPPPAARTGSLAPELPASGGRSSARQSSTGR